MDFSWSGQSQGQLWLVLCFAPVNDFSVSGSSPSDSRHNPITKKYIQTHSSWTLAFQWKTEYNFYCCEPPLPRMECSHSVPCPLFSHVPDLRPDLMGNVNYDHLVILGDPRWSWWSLVIGLQNQEGWSAGDLTVQVQGGCSTERGEDHIRHYVTNQGKVEHKYLHWEYGEYVGLVQPTIISKATKHVLLSSTEEKNQALALIVERLPLLWDDWTKYFDIWTTNRPITV